MDYDENKVDEVVLALMNLTLHDEIRAWKGFDFRVLDRLITMKIHRERAGRSPTKKTTTDLNQDTTLVNLLRNAVEHSASEDGWAYFLQILQHIAKQAPEFDTRNYG